MELFAYDEVHAGYFFGREEDIRSISEKIYRDNAVLLYGESGVGKTSLVNAGLLPLLQKEGVIVASLTVRPGFTSTDILKTLQSIVPSPQLQPSSGEAKSFIETFQDVAKSLRSNEQRLVVILDQVETIFLGAAETRAELGYSLARAVSGEP